MPQLHPVQNDVLMLITTNTLHREPFFANNAHAREAIETLYRLQKLHPFDLYGFVIMPDHCHILLYVPPPERISKIMNSYKSGVTFNTGIPVIWQQRFHIRIIDDPFPALQYIYQNPVKADLCAKPEEYKWSSASGKWPVKNINTYKPQ